MRTPKLISVCLATTALTLLAAPAAAQITEDPEYPNEDEFGVDNRTFQTRRIPMAPTISIGSSSDPMTFVIDNDRYNGMVNAISLDLNIDGVNYSSNSNGDYIYLWVNGNARNYKCVSSTCKRDSDDGSYFQILNPNKTSLKFVTESGTEYAIQSDGFHNSYQDDYWDYYVTSIKRADGKTFSITQQKTTYTFFGATIHITRPLSITSSDGFMGKFVYNYDAPTTNDSSPWRTNYGVKLYNLSSDGCDPDLTYCNGSPSAEFSITRSTNSSGQRIVQATDQANRAWAYKISRTYTLFDLESIKFPGSTNDDLVYNRSSEYGTISSVTLGGRQWSYAFSYYPAVHARTDPLGHIIDYGFSADSITDELGRTTTYTFGTDRKLAKVTYPEGNYVSYTYDTRGNRVAETVTPKSGSGLSAITRSWAFPSSCSNPVTCNKPTSVTNELGQVTDYTYDAVHGGLLTVTAPAPSSGAPRPQMRYTYSQLYPWYKNSSGTIVQGAAPIYKLTGTSQCRTLSNCAGTADEIVTSIGYQAGSVGQGSNLFPVSSSTGSGDGSLTATSSMTYDSVGNVLSVDGPLPGSADTTRTAYDVARRAVGVVTPDPDGSGSLKPRAARTTYNAKGQVTLVERGTVWSPTDDPLTALTVTDQVASSYDPTTGEKTLDVASAGGNAYAATQYSYDAEGKLECVAQRMNPEVFGSLPTSACTLGTAGTFGPDRISKTTYDAAHQVTKTQAGVGTTSVIDEVTSTYTSNGKAASVTDANGNKTTYEYDGFDRLAKQRYPSPTTPGTSSTTDYDQPSYDAAGNVTSLRLRDGQAISLTYDALNRVVLKDVPNTVAGELDVTTTYDNLNRPLTISTSADTITYAYDGLGRNISETSFAGQKSFQYDLAGRLTRLTWPGGSLYADYDYLVTGEVAKIRENGATSGVGVLAAYTYDNLGRRTGVTRGNGTSTSYGFDAISRLTSLSQNLDNTPNDVTTTFAYNPASEITSQTRGNDAYAWPGRVNVNRGYTTNGLNQHTLSGATALTYDGRGNLATSQGTSYGYTSENRLASAGGVSLSYDPLGRLKQVVGTGTTRFDYIGDALIAELDNSNTVLRRYVPGPGQDEPIVWYEGSGLTNRRWLHADERGSVIAVSDASGAALQLNSYDEYGIPASTNLGRFQYTGQTFLPEIGMYYYKARIYSPTLGRFLQTDPIGYGDGLNMYAYVANNPINRVDPTGTDIVCAPSSKQDTASMDCREIVVTGTCSLGMSCRSYGPEAIDSLRPSYMPPSMFSTAFSAAPSSLTGQCDAALRTAKADRSAIARARGAWKTLSNAANRNGINPALLAAIGVRETGFRNIGEVGGGSGMGIFQLTNQPNVSRAQAFDLGFSANYAARMLSSNMKSISTRFPGLSSYQILQATAASYNFGLRNISGNPNAIDSGTTNNNYGSNVINLMSCF